MPGEYQHGRLPGLRSRDSRGKGTSQTAKIRHRERLKVLARFLDPRSCVFVRPSWVVLVSHCSWVVLLESYLWVVFASPSCWSFQRIVSKNCSSWILPKNRHSEISLQVIPESRLTNLLRIRLRESSHQVVPKTRHCESLPPIFPRRAVSPSRADRPLLVTYSFYSLGH